MQAHACYYRLILGEECKDYLLKHFTELYDNRSDDYANGRDVRNYFESIVTRQASRVSALADPSDADVTTICAKDVVL